MSERMKPTMCQMNGCGELAVGTLRGVAVCLKHGRNVGSKLRMMRNLMHGGDPARYVEHGRVKLPEVRVEEVLDDGSTRELRRAKDGER